MDDVLYPNLRAVRSTFTALVLLACVLVGYLAYRTFGDRGTPAVEPRAITPRGDLSGDEKATIELFKQTAPSVVFITTLSRRYDMRMQAVDIPEGTGSGFIWDDAGDVVTNFHVVRNATGGAKVALSNHETYDADVVGAAPEFDLAVLRIRAPRSKLTKILVGTSADLQVGQKVFAIGNPFGLDHTLTTGIVSATGRTIPGIAGPIQDVIQTDAAINPGNSGGPLLDSAGRLIGVNTAIYSQSGASAGIGFAVPVDTVNRIVPQLIQSGKAIRPRLGVGLGNPDFNAEITRRMGVTGVLVVTVQPGSAAERAGLRATERSADGRIIPGDVILKIDDRPVRNAPELFTTLGRFNVGDTVKLTVFRLGETLEIPIALDGETPAPQ
jgi:S1-C subfamily serine protease